MKKLIIYLLTGCFLCTLTLSSNQVKAIDFEGQEDKYIKLCSSSLSNSDKSTCEEFNKYLSEKNSKLKDEMSNSKKELAETNDNINQVSQKISSITSQINAKENEINYLLTSITNIEKDIEDKEQQMKDRLYIMQTTYNSNWIIDFLFGSEDFSTFFSRLSNVNDITAYEKELIKELTEQKENLNIQKQSLSDAKAALQSQKESQLALQDQLINLKTKQQNSIAANQQEIKETSEAQKKIDAALEELISRAPTGGGGSYIAGSSETGNAIAQQALSKLGARYWWGANGPTYFDCSGLVYWAHNQAGVQLGRTSAAGYASAGKAVTRDQLQAGDVITFSYGSGVAHIGIYIGGGSFVHASGYGSSTVGQDPNQCVMVSPLAGYWQNYVYNYRRLY